MPIRDLMVRLVLILIFSILTLDVAQARKIELASPLYAELNQVLKASEGLQHAMISKSEDQLDSAVREIVLQIQRTVALSGLAKPYERNHLLRILRTARENFEMAQGAFGHERDSHLTVGLNQLVNLVRIYRVDRSYGIFFCAQDRNSWIQKGRKAQNPFRGPASKVGCGIRVSD